jgi:hypothetical protein
MRALDWAQRDHEDRQLVDLQLHHALEHEVHHHIRIFEVNSSEQVDTVGIIHAAPDLERGDGIALSYETLQLLNGALGPAIQWLGSVEIHDG